MIGDATTRRFRLAFNVLAVVSAAALLLAGWALYARFEQTNQLRNSNKHVWHGVVCAIEKSILKSTNTTPQQKQAKLRFFDRLLIVDVQTDGCGLATHPKGEHQ